MAKLFSPAVRSGAKLPCLRGTPPTMSLLESLAGVAQFPSTILVLLQQIGGFATAGALNCVGCNLGRLNALLYRHPAGGYDSETRGICAEWSNGASALDYSVGVEFPVNGKEGEGWRMAVSFDGNDTYSAWLWATAHNGTANARLLGSIDGLDSEALIEAIDNLYIEALGKFNDGFIPDA